MALYTNLLDLPIELQLCIMEKDVSAYLKWPILSKTAATSTRFDYNLKKHGKWLRKTTRFLFDRKERFTLTSRFMYQQYWNHGVIEGQHKRWDFYGTLTEEFYIVDDKLEGEYKLFHAYCGNLKEHCYYVKGLKHGEYKSFYKGSGKLKEQCYYVNGLKHGEYKLWKLSDGIWEHRHYVNGKLDGEFKSWHWYRHGDGSPIVRVHCHYANGKKNGECKLWYYDGNLMEHLHYVDGIKQGEMKKWNRDGELVVHCFYNNDQVIEYAVHDE